MTRAHRAAFDDPEDFDSFNDDECACACHAIYEDQLRDEDNLDDEASQ